MAGEPLYRQLERRLRDEIGSGRLLPGDRLPAEPELAAQYQMARMTARHAIEALVQDGLLVRHRGRGTFVAEPRMAYPPASLVSFSRTMRALGRPVTTKLLDFEVVPANGEVAGLLGEAENTPVLFVRRLRFLDGEPVAIHSSYMHRAYLEGMHAADLLTKPISEAMEKVTGVRIVSSRDFMEAAATTSEEAALLNILAGEPIAVVRGVSSAADGSPALATRAVYRGDRFRFFVGSTNSGPFFEVNLPSSSVRDAGGKATSE